MSRLLSLVLLVFCLLVVCPSSTWGGTFYHSTKFLYMNSIANDGLKLIQPFNGCELGLGFYVTSSKSLMSQYGNYYLELQADVGSFAECVSFDELVANDHTFKSTVDAMGSNYNIWWTKPYILGFSFDGVEMAWRTPENLPKTFVNTKANESPVCVTRKTFGNQMKFNAIMPAGSHAHPPFNTKVQYKGNLRLSKFCQINPPVCHTPEEMKDPKNALKFLEVDRRLALAKQKTFAGVIQNKHDEGLEPSFTDVREHESVSEYLKKLEALEHQFQAAAGGHSPSPDPVHPVHSASPEASHHPSPGASHHPSTGTSHHPPANKPDLKKAASTDSIKKAPSGGSGGGGPGKLKRTKSGGTLSSKTSSKTH